MLTRCLPQTIDPVGDATASLSLPLRSVIFLAPLIVLGSHALLVRRYRRRLRATPVVRRPHPLGALDREEDLTREVDIRVRAERGGMIALVAGILGVCFGGLITGGAAQTVVLYASAGLIALGPAEFPKLAYRLMSPGRPLPAHFRTEVRELIRGPFKAVTDPAERARLALAGFLRLASFALLAFSVTTLPAALLPSTGTRWRLFPVVLFVVGYPLLRFATRLRSGVITRSKTFEPAEFLALTVESTGALLRSFTDDSARLATRASIRLSDMEFLSVGSRADRFERILAWALWPYVPTFALTDPKRMSRTDPGMGRITLPEKDPWQPLATSLIERAAVLVVLMGDSPSLLWEIENLAANSRIERTLFVIPPTISGRSERVRSIASLVGLPDPELADDQPVIGFCIDEIGFRWFTSELADEHAYAVMVERFVGVNPK